ncbi:hypothetical protein, partial [uncultured Methanobrevibacter sp.]|uniref:hypothetical protein n=1 Tax=uncultured Methanobrevibacter sp. TaxID=253161 RepID=UPI0025CBF15A
FKTINKTTTKINLYNKRLYFIVYKIKGKISEKKLKINGSHVPSCSLNFLIFIHYFMLFFKKIDMFKCNKNVIYYIENF